MTHLMSRQARSSNFPTTLRTPLKHSCAPKSSTKSAITMDMPAVHIGRPASDLVPHPNLCVISAVRTKVRSHQMRSSECLAPRLAPQGASTAPPFHFYPADTMGQSQQNEDHRRSPPSLPYTKITTPSTLNAKNKLCNPPPPTTCNGASKTPSPGIRLTAPPTRSRASDASPKLVPPLT
jgi:hypothetical protein